MASLQQQRLHSLRILVGQILMTGAAQWINFRLGPFRVNGAGLGFIATALRSRAHGQHGIRIRLGHVGPDAGAAYDPVTNTLDFPDAGFGHTEYDRAAIIHECVHALRDSHGPRFKVAAGMMSPNWMMDEAAAYIAGALFHIYDTTPSGQAPAPPGWAPVFDEAHRVAVRIMSQPGAIVSPLDANALMLVVRRSRAYRRLRNRPNYRYRNNGLDP